MNVLKGKKGVVKVLKKYGKVWNKRFGKFEENLEEKLD